MKTRTHTVGCSVILAERKPSPASRLLQASVAGLLLLGVAGCTLIPAPKVDPTRYYVLTGPAFDEPGVREMGGTLVVGLTSVTVAPYLNGKAMIVRGAANEIAYQDFARWAEPLDVSVGRMIAARLVSAPTIKRVYPQPFPFDVERNYDVSLEVLRCEGARRADGALVASFVCMVEVSEAKAGGAVVMRKLFTAPETAWDGKDYGALAKQLSEAIGSLGVEVASAVSR
jgi:uncharacterized protein